MDLIKKEEKIIDKNIIEEIASLFPSEAMKHISSHENIITSYRRISYTNSEGSLHSVFFGPSIKLPKTLNALFDQVYTNVPNLKGYPSMYNVREIEGGFERCEKNLPEVTFNMSQMLTITL